LYAHGGRIPAPEFLSLPASLPTPYHCPLKAGAQVSVAWLLVSDVQKSRVPIAPSRVVLPGLAAKSVPDGILDTLHGEGFAARRGPDGEVELCPRSLAWATLDLSVAVATRAAGVAVGGDGASPSDSVVETRARVVPRHVARLDTHAPVRDTVAVDTQAGVRAVDQRPHVRPLGSPAALHHARVVSGVAVEVSRNIGITSRIGRGERRSATLELQVDVQVVIVQVVVAIVQVVAVEVVGERRTDRPSRSQRAERQ